MKNSDTSATSHVASQCAECGASFTCGMVAGQEQCWCAEKPALMIADDTGKCYCPACFDKKVEQQQSH